MPHNSYKLLAPLGALLLCSCAMAQSPKPLIHNFSECVAAGYPIARTLPARCATPEGFVFIDESNPRHENSPKLCNDRCGNGKCEEIVCTAIGCPCPETAQSCPKDCAKQ